MITSSTNPKVKYVKRLQNDRRFRHLEHTFVVEGTRWLSELIPHSPEPRQTFYTEKWLETADNAQILQQIKGLKQVVDQSVMAAMSATEAAPGVLSLLPMSALPLPSNPKLFLILDGVANPGNMGTMLRTAGAAGVDGVFLAPGCVDLYNPKVVRGGMGIHLRLPILRLDWDEIARRVAGFGVWLAVVTDGVAYTAVNWQQPSALIIGNEANGVGEDAERLANGRLTIPMHAQTESLNAAVAAAIILFEAVKEGVGSRE